MLHPTSANRLLRLQELLETISSELELRPLLDRILAAGCELLSADDGTIGLYDPERDLIRTEVAHNMPAAELGCEAPRGIGLGGRVLATGEPVVLDRYGLVDQPLRPELSEQAVIGVPITWRGRLMGVFGIGAQPPRRFSPDDVELLSLLARHAAVAIENARLYGREQRRGDRLALIARIGQIASAGFAVDELLQRAADAIHEQLGYPNVDIPLVDLDDPGMLVIRVRGGHHKRTITWEDRLPMDRGIMGAAVLERRPQLVNDVTLDPRYVRPPGPVESRAELAVPILLGNQEALGVLNVESPVPFDQDDIQSLQIVADALAVAIRNARLFESAQRLAVLEERQRLSRDLHDSVTQHLFSVTLLAQSIGKAFGRGPAEGDQAVERVLALTRTALAEMRALIHELRPEPSDLPAEISGLVRLRAQGLEVALRRHLADVSVGELQVEFELPDARLPAEREELLFRVAQEALNNVVKHAEARHVRIALSVEDGQALLRIADDGRGFDPTAASPVGPGGLGLPGMRERTAAAGGRLELESAPGQGTQLRLTLPLA